MLTRHSDTGCDDPRPSQQRDVRAPGTGRPQSDEFAAESTKQTQWRAFTARNQAAAPELQVIIHRDQAQRTFPHGYFSWGAFFLRHRDYAAAIEKFCGSSRTRAYAGARYVGTLRRERIRTNACDGQMLGPQKTDSDGRQRTAPGNCFLPATVLQNVCLSKHPSEG